MVELGKTYSGKTVIGLDGSWVKYDEGNGWQGECMKETFILRYVPNELELAQSAPETTASPSETAADKGILTEEELKELLKEVIILKGLKIRSSVDLINSHRNLLSANAELSFKNNKYREALNSILEGDWGRSMDEDGLATHFTDRIDPHKIAKEALEETK